MGGNFTDEIWVAGLVRIYEDIWDDSFSKDIWVAVQLWCPKHHISYVRKGFVSFSFVWFCSSGVSKSAFVLMYVKFFIFPNGRHSL